MNERMKYIIKKMLGRNYTFLHSEFKVDEMPDSIKRVIEDQDDLLEEKTVLGKRKDRKPFYDTISTMEPNYNFFNNGVYEYGKDDVKDIFEYDGLQSGTPLRWKPFKPCINNIRRELRSKRLYWYYGASGTLTDKQIFIDYLKREGFNDVCNKKMLGIENITFTCSTTHGYRLILESIAHDEDVVLVTAPNYGLFATVVELTSAHVETVDVLEEDNWYVNPKRLEERIDEINKKLKKKFKDSDLGYTPRVVAFLNMNPHNPLGKVMNSKNIDILKGIGDVCLDKGVFVIDDLIYRDLTFDQDDLATPMASFTKYFNNTISLFGISKSFGLASIRSGVLVAPTIVSRAINKEIEKDILSFPTLQSTALTGAFNATDKRYRDVKKYLTPIINEYKYRYNLLYALVEGIDKIDNESLKKRIIKDINKYEKDNNMREILLKGIPGVEIRKGTVPESGFFAVLDFTKLKGLKYGEFTINKDVDLLSYFYNQGKVKFIMGSNVSWPYPDEIIGRVAFSLDIKALIYSLKIINESVRKLK